MKHHKVKGVWKHKPDALPLPDAPSTGARKKKGPLEKASKKHLFDLLHQGRKEIHLRMKWLGTRSLGSLFEFHMTEWCTEDIDKQCEKMDKVVLELERRMG
jgi:hypothetical protein